MVNQTSVNLVRPMVSYRALALGLDPVNLGLLSAAFSIAPLVVALRIGRLVDQRGELLFIFGGTIVMGIVTLGLAVSPSSPSLFLLFALLGLGHLSITVATQGMVARGSDEAVYDRRFAAFSLSAAMPGR